MFYFLCKLVCVFVRDENLLLCYNVLLLLLLKHTNYLDMVLSCTSSLETRLHGNRRRHIADDNRCDDVVVFLRHMSHYILTTRPNHSILHPLHVT